MGFAIGIEKERQQEAAIRGAYQKAAVGCWFTSTGKVTPLMIKYEDEEGELHVLKDIRVMKTEQKYYAGVLRRRFDCCAVIEGCRKEFVLLYHPEENIWDMVLRG